MANTAQARKRARQAERHRQRNAGQRSLMRTKIKKVVSAIDAKDREGATAAYLEMVSAVDQTANRGLIHQNKASRYKSRLNAQIRAI